MIIDLTTLKSYLGITGTDEDANLTIIVDAINAQINHLTGRVWGATVTVTDEEHDYEPVFLSCRKASLSLLA